MRKALLLMASVAVLGALVFGFAAPGQADERIKGTCLAAVTGVYLNILGSPPLSSSLVTISPQGLIEATDSDEDGDTGSFDPFSPAHGVLTDCKKLNGSYSVKGYTLDYGWPELAGHADPGVAGGMARVNYDVTISGNALTGQILLTPGLVPQAGAAAAKTGTGTGQFSAAITGERLH
jgi:hypothetical protein